MSSSLSIRRFRSRRAIVGIVLVTMGFLFLSGLGGCAPAQLSPQVARSMVDLRQDLTLGKTKIESAASILTDLMKNPRGNTARQIELYQKEMACLEEIAQRVRDTHTRMEVKSDEYFQTWEKELGQIQNKDIAAAGAQRKQASLKAMETVRDKLDAAKGVFSPFISNLRDISRYLKNDETADAVTAVTPVIRKTLAQKQASIKSIDDVITAIDQVTKTSQ